ncbi:MULTISPECIES: hypothetical protein [unclassified Lysinibacillus]|uniref:hypothetical protein n=1 Tax=unclassified Lysinibacillus TaxID=2636778 RepID=UPI0035D8A530
MKFSFELGVNTTPDKIWPLYANVNEWFKWEADLKDISLNGEFVKGSTGTMELEGQPPIVFELVSVEENKCFCDKTSIPGLGDLYFDHKIIEGVDQSIIKHTVELKNAKTTEENINFLNQVFRDVPMSIISIKKLVEK